MAVVARLLDAFRKVARGAVPDIDYKTTYRARVVKQHPNRRRLDVVPTDPRLPSMTNIPLKVGVPGLEVVLVAGHFVLVGWENGRPDHPYATLWDAGEQGTTPTKLILHAASIELGGKNLIPLMDSVVLGRTPCQFTGAPHHVAGAVSTKVLAKP
jgi:hypothetical protein